MDWNQAYLDENTPWDKGMPSPVIIELLGDIPINAKMVVPGCGTGNDIVALLDVNPVSVVGIDIAPEAIALLRKRFDCNPVVHPVLGDFVQHAAEHPASSIRGCRHRAHLFLCHSSRATQRIRISLF